MNKIFILSLLCLLSFTFLSGHEGHKEIHENKPTKESIQTTQGPSLVKQYEGRPQSWIQWIGVCKPHF